MTRHHSPSYPLARLLFLAALAAPGCLPTDVGNPFDDDPFQDAGAGADAASDAGHVADEGGEGSSESDASNEDARHDTSSPDAEQDASWPDASEDTAGDSADDTTGDDADDGPDGADGSGEGDVGPDVEPDTVIWAADEIVPYLAAGPTDHFFDAPWPSDARLRDDGSPDLARFPRSTTGLMRTFRDGVEGRIVGYSLMPVAYVRFDGPVAGVTLPSPADTLTDASTVQLIDVSEAGCGARVPLRTRIFDGADPYIPAGTLAATPVPGFALKASTTYALLVTDDFGASDGLAPVRTAAFDAALSGDTASPFAASLEPLRHCADVASIDLSRVVAATAFTTQDPATELRRLREFVVDPALTPAPVVEGLARDTALSVDGGRQVWRGTFDAPIFQRGVPPYHTDGAFAYDEAGVPAVQRWEEVPFTLTLPPGDAAAPVLVWVDGTSATLNGILRSATTSAALGAGFAVASFAPQFHDSRAVPGSDPVLHGFNYVNPISGRTVFRQQVLEVAYFVRVLREALGDDVLSAAGADALVGRLDTTTLLYGGHSQGGIVGAMVAGVETEFAAYLFNGTGAYISETIVSRTDPIDIQALVGSLFGVPSRVDVFHPIVALAQLGVDVVEPHAYAPYYRGWAAHPAGAHMLVVNGQNDVTTFPDSINALTIHVGLTPIAPAGWDVDAYATGAPAIPAERAAPFGGNTTSFGGDPLTFATFLDADGTHSTLRNNARAMEIAMAFLTQSLTDVPSIPEAAAP